ncbi:VOC family protein [Streptomyces sp. 8L]|uniref:VOC family protein n=1 Tax=Streptomyces sp. 8L TaxID=2877242 RepID=UPI001CD3352D|nr:VOC family protein [Streptomyces sp. 8L]MCA1217440.1 VOC family protein [Streptomyces sp. 8L]
MSFPRPFLRLTGPVLNAPDPALLAAFYRELLGWHTESEEPDWVKLRGPGGTGSLAFQIDPDFVPPVWPGSPGEARMTMHLDIETDDLAEAVGRAIELGAREAGYQPEEDVRVCLDPIGHVFCFWTRT